MKNRFRPFAGLTRADLILWSGSVCLIVGSFFIFDRENYLTLIASLLGVSSLIYSAKGNPICQVLMIIFSILYGVISYGYRYYGEMVTYLGMTMPMAILSLISWLRNPYAGSRSEVKVNRLRLRELIFALLLTAIVTWVFYYILRRLGTANLIPSTVSVATSFFAAYLTLRRSALYALAYAANDSVLIVLWLMAAREDISYLSVFICFFVFLINDFYGFASWTKMMRRQNAAP